MSSYNNNKIKQRTIELYDALPHDKDARMSCKHIRDEIIELNYPFFGYVANNTFVDNTTYEDKFQTALMSFLGMWWKYRWTPKYRADLSFGVFFKPRISEEIRRHLSLVSYSSRRALCLEVAEQLGKPWSQVCYDDLAHVNLSSDKMNALKAMFRASQSAELDKHESSVEFNSFITSKDISKYMFDQYNSIEELLIQEMIRNESPLSSAELNEISDTFCIDINLLIKKLPKAMNILHNRLHNANLNI